jgi:hypothetical protein
MKFCFLSCHSAWYSRIFSSNVVQFVEIFPFLLTKTLIKSG